MCVSACVFYVCNKCFYAFVFISDVKLRAHNFGVRLPLESQVQAYRELSEHYVLFNIVLFCLCVYFCLLYSVCLFNIV